MFIKNDNINNQLLSLNEEYGSLYAIPLFLLEDMILSEFNNFSPYSDELFNKDLVNYDIFIRKFIKNDDSEINVYFILVDLLFKEDNRVGLWIKDDLFLFIPYNCIEEAFGKRENIRKWIRRGEYHYIFKYLSSLYNVSYKSNFNDYMINYDFEIFMSLPDEVDDYDNFYNWWLLGGNLFYWYIKDTLSLVVNKINHLSFYDSYKYFSDLKLCFYKDRHNIRVPINIGMFFNVDFHSRLNIVMPNLDDSDAIIGLLSKMIPRFYDLYRIISISDEVLDNNSSFIKFIDDGIENTAGFIAHYENKKYILEIHYSSVKNLSHMADMGKFSDLEYCEKYELVIEWKILLINFLDVIFSIL